MSQNEPDLIRDNTHSCGLRELIPAPIYVEDWSEVERFCEEQRTAGVTDLRSMLVADRDLVRSLAGRIEVVAVNRKTIEFVGVAEETDLLGNLPTELLNDNALDSLIEQIMTVWNRELSLSLEMNGTDMGGAAIPCQLDWSAPIRGGEPDYSEVVVLLRDLRVHREEQLQSRESIRRLETLLDMSRGIAATFDIDLILELLVETALELTDADQSLILLVDPEEETLTTAKGRGFEQEVLDSHTYAEVMDGLSGVAIRTREALRSDDIAADPINVGLAQQRAQGLAGTAVAIAPIIIDDLAAGTLTVLNGPGEAKFSAEELSLVRMLASQAAVAMRNAELYEEIRASRDSLEAAHEELKHTQTQLLGAQQMEAIGGLAAGIAHEINTPIQFVSDNIAFIAESGKALAKHASAHIQLLAKLAEHPEHGEEIRSARQLWKDEDCDFLLEELPDAIQETQEGASRVSDIVKAMKEFAHPGQEDLTPSDINRVIETTVQVSRNEWKYVAEIELDLDDTLPMIPCLPGPLGQSLLIMIVNSAQAMDGHHDGMGKIKISSRGLGDIVEIRVSDNGPGIPVEILGRVFEPFFTTKEIGKGSGQGLSIAHSVIVDKHKGQIWADNTYPGAVFVMHIPAEEAKKSKQAEEDA